MTLGRKSVCFFNDGLNLFGCSKAKGRDSACMDLSVYSVGEPKRMKTPERLKGFLGKRIRINRSRWQNELAILLSSCIDENFAAMVSSFDLAPNILMRCH
ncbi:Disease resistance-like protein [Corchorus olitorius]|uniref:Disease resistance-like protein n=1 Tax=Corchorus olitorius TaxID=93759 RepID=A0A1R3GGB2_9ROSI|nr:Disease resistance-like protein [Corchorus olitorius]